MNQLRKAPTYLLLSACLALQAVGRAQEQSIPHPLEPADTSSYAATLDSLVSACNELHQLVLDGAIVEDGSSDALVLPAIERILDCLDLSELPMEMRKTAGLEAALFLKEVLDRIQLPSSEEIPVFETTAAQSTSHDRWSIPNTRIAITRKISADYGEIFAFSSESVRRASEFYRMVKTLPYRSEGRVVSPGLRDAYIDATKQQTTQKTDTSSPRGTLTLFIDSCNKLHEAITQDQYPDKRDPKFVRLAGQIISCLDTSELPEYTREYYDAEAAVCLKEVLDRIPLPPAEQIPGPESVESREGHEPLNRWQVPRSQIVISRIPDGPRRGEYLFSAATVSGAPDLYAKVADQPYQTGGEHAPSEGFYSWWLSVPGTRAVAKVVDYLPQWCQTRLLGMSIWQAIGMLVAMPIGLATMFLLFTFGRREGERVRERSLLRYWLSFVWFAIAVGVPLVFKHIVWEYLTLRGTPLYVVNFCCDVLVLLGIVGLVIAISSRAADSFVALPQVAPKSLDANLIRIVCRVLGIAAAVIIFLEGGRYLGFPLTTLLASAGIGGLAIALSAQGLVRGLFGTVTILLDKPYRVGERIVVKGHDGIVEEIGLRSTKIRDFSSHLISIPNDLMAEAEIENVGKRNHIRRVADIRIPIDTRREKVEQAIGCLRNILDKHEGMDPEFPPRVCFTDYTPDAFNIRIIYWYTPADFWRHYEFCDKLNLRILSTFEEQGIQLSLPVRHTYWNNDSEKGSLEVVVLDEAKH